MDKRYGTYGRLPGSEISYRIGNGNGDDGDMITVGKLDSYRCGPYCKEPTMKIVKDFHWRSDAVILNMSEADNAKISILRSQIRAEAPLIPAIKETWENSHPGEAPVVEIANEPNLYPYLSPELYAWYYKEWHQIIRKSMPNAKIMNGGFFILEGYPSSILKLLGLIKIGVKSTREYYDRFYAALMKGDGDRFIPDIINLHFYPYLTQKQIDDYDVRGHFKILESLMTHANVWITEFGNINPLTMKETAGFLRDILSRLEVTNVKKWHYFQVRGTDSKWQMLIERKGLVSKLCTAWRIIIFVFRLPGLSHMVNFILGLFKLPKIKEVDELFEIAFKYLNQLPIQGLIRKDGSLNELGEIYKEFANKS